MYIVLAGYFFHALHRFFHKYILDCLVIIYMFHTSRLFYVCCVLVCYFITCYAFGSYFMHLMRWPVLRCIVYVNVFYLHVMCS